jgi:hypothetical protein
MGCAAPHYLARCAEVEWRAEPEADGSLLAPCRRRNSPPPLAYHHGREWATSCSAVTHAAQESNGVAEPDAVDRLYALPPAEFTAARNELAMQLRKQGDRPGSDAVKALGKPSVTAWALNQVARGQPRLVERLLTAGQELGRAQQALLAGRGQAAFREATRTERDAVAELVRAAAGVLAESGHPAAKAILDRLEATGRAASTDPAAGEQLSAGRLTADLDPAGFGGLSAGAFGLPAAPIPFPAARQAQKPSAREEPPPDNRADQLAEARTEVRRLQQELQSLRKQAAESEAQAARARQAATKADRAWAEARDAAAIAEKAAAQARRAEEDAAEDLSNLRAQLDQAAESLENAEATLRTLRRD